VRSPWDPGGPAPTVGEAVNTYRILDGKICRLIPIDDLVEVQPLCNFQARIVEDVVVDDGVETKRHFVVEAEAADGTPLGRATIPADEFSRLDWVVPAFGPRAIIEPGRATVEHLRVAIQTLSRPTLKRVYRHTEWREIDENPYFLHAGGAIGPDGPDGAIAVDLPDALRLFRLPDPPTGPERVAAIRATLALGDGLGPDRLVLPLLAAAVRPVLGAPNYSIHVQGRTNTFKTELGALVQRHYGREMSADRLPLHWSSTENAMEATAAARDVVLVADDYVPAGGGLEASALNRKADRLIRAVGNQGARQRCRRDGSPMAARPPRCLLISTGEETPRGQSLQTRMLRLDVAPEDVDRARSTACQEDAEAGRYAATTAAFVAWLAPRLREPQARLRTEARRLRCEQVAAEAARTMPRTIGIVADLLAGVGTFLDFAVEAGAIADAERDRRLARFRAAFVAGFEEQVPEDPAERYLALLRAALATGVAYLLDCDGKPPIEEARSSCGWGPGRHGTDSPRGRHVGWIDGDTVYLEPEAAFAVVQGLAESQGEPLPFRKETLHKRLHERGHLRATEPSRQTLVVRRMIDGARRSVLEFAAEVLEIGGAPGRRPRLTAVGGSTGDLPGASPSPPRAWG
jgi:hypothetical protein